MAASFSQNSRFACLSVDDEDDSDEQGQNKKQINQNGAKSTAAKKRNRKKKKAEQAEKAELRELAFGLGASAAKPKKQTPTVPNTKKAGGSGDSEEQWNEWRKADEEFTNEQYESDLQQAILQSKLEFEKTEELKVTGGTVSEAAKDNKKKKKKKAAMSLEEFSHFDENKESDEIVNMNQPKTPEKITSPDPDFFNRVDKDASKTILKEKIQEEYTKQYIVQNARTAHYEKEISKKDKEIIMLRATVEKLKEEALDAKQRNQQLCSILAQGEMKDKAAVLQSLDELNQVKNELMDEINHLTAELEKEKSKSHALKTELERYQAKSSKHK